MQAVRFPRVVAALAVIVAAVLVLRGRAPNVELPAPAVLERAPAPDSEAPPSSSRETLNTATETPAAAKVRELNEMSETFRNTSFLIAIRDSGFICNELLGVYGGVNNSTTWTASCSEMLAYTVSVASAGTLHIEPLLQYLDGVAPLPQREPGREPRRDFVLPPQRR